MEHRIIPRAPLSLGVVGLGCEGLLDKPLEYYIKACDMMEAAGANCIDLYSPNPDMRSRLGQALSGRREKFILQGHLCSCWQNGQYKCERKLDRVKASFEDQLERLGTTWLDIGMIHYVDSLKSWREVCDNGVLDYVKELKKTGVIKAIGLSSHNPLLALEVMDVLDVLMFSVNPCYDLQPPDEDVEQLWNRDKYEGVLVDMHPARARLYQKCQELGIGITVMKAFGGGDLLHAEKSLAHVALHPHQAIAYALDRPGVVCVLAGARSLEELAQCLEYGESRPEDKDYAPVLATFPRISWKGHCMYCGHCAPCPANIDIAMVTKLLNLAQTQKEVPETVAEHYRALEHKAHECLFCGVCEPRCPFDVPIRQNIARARNLFFDAG